MSKSKKSKRYSKAEKLRVVRLHLEEGYTYKFISAQTGIGNGTIGNWVKGEALS